MHRTVIDPDLWLGNHKIFARFPGRRTLSEPRRSRDSSSVLWAPATGPRRTGPRRGGSRLRRPICWQETHLTLRGVLSRGESQSRRGITRDPNRKRRKGETQASPLSKVIWRRPTLPGTFVPSTIGAGGLNFCVRDGNRCDPSAMATKISCQMSGGPKRGSSDNSRTSLRARTTV